MFVVGGQVRQEHQLHPGLAGFPEGRSRSDRVKRQGQDDVRIQRKRGFHIGKLLGAVEPGRGGGNDLDPEAGEFIGCTGGHGIHEICLIMPEECRLQPFALKLCHLGVVKRDLRGRRRRLSRRA